MTNHLESRRRNRLSQKRLDLHEIFVRADFQFFRRAPFLDLRPRRFRFVKAIQTLDHPIDFRFADQIFFEQLV